MRDGERRGGHDGRAVEGGAGQAPTGGAVAEDVVDGWGEQGVADGAAEAAAVAGGWIGTYWGILSTVGGLNGGVGRWTLGRAWFFM